MINVAGGYLLKNVISRYSMKDILNNLTNDKRKRADLENKVEHMVSAKFFGGEDGQGYNLDGNPTNDTTGYRASLKADSEVVDFSGLGTDNERAALTDIVENYCNNKKPQYNEDIRQAMKDINDFKSENADKFDENGNVKSEFLDRGNIKPGSGVLSDRYPVLLQNLTNARNRKINMLKGLKTGYLSTVRNEDADKILLAIAGDKRSLTNSRWDNNNSFDRMFGTAFYDQIKGEYATYSTGMHDSDAEKRKDAADAFGGFLKKVGLNPTFVNNFFVNNPNSVQEILGGTGLKTDN